MLGLINLADKGVINVHSNTVKAKGRFFMAMHSSIDANTAAVTSEILQWNCGNAKIQYNETSLNFLCRLTLLVTSVWFSSKVVFH